MDELAQYNRERWNALVEAEAVFTRPVLNLDPHLALEEVDPERRLGTIAGKDVLCLACGGGQQSVAFALLGANVTVFDLSDAQLQRDRQAALHYSVDIRLQQGDMRDLSGFASATFDIVYHAYSLNFVPDAPSVFGQIARVLRPGGIYHFMCANPFFIGLGPQDWNGTGYTLHHHYLPGTELRAEDQAWAYDRSKSGTPIRPSREFRHTLSALVSGLIEHRFVVLHISDYSRFTPDPQAEGGTWAHFLSVAPPWLSFWAAYHPEGVFQAG